MRKQVYMRLARIIAILALTLFGPVTFNIMCLSMNVYLLSDFYKFLPKAMVVQKAMGIILSVILLLTSFSFVQGFFDWRVTLIGT